MEQLFVQLFASPVASTILVITLITSIRAFRDPLLKQRFMFNPHQVWQQRYFPPFLTSGLIHANGWHLAFNMIAYYYFALPLERFIGHWQFAVLYILSLIISDIPTLIRHKEHPHYQSLGASGAVSAVVFSMILFNPELGIGLIFIPGYLPGWLFGLLYLGFSFVASMKAWGNINHDAHLWGSLAGIVLTLLLQPSVAVSFKQWLLTAF